MLKGDSHLFKVGLHELHVICECDSHILRLLFKKEAGKKDCAFLQMNNIGNIRKYQTRKLI